jgi:maltose O-acetyltransferase
LDNDAHHADPTKREMGIIPSRPIIIEDNVFIGLQCVILKGVTIGKNSVIGANSVVFNNVPENSIAVGNPCKVIMRRNPANYQ